MAYTVHSFLQSSKSADKLGTTHVVQPPVAYYVILGRGAAAAVDHATLRQTDFGRKRLTGADGKALPVMHLGMPDPWLNYSAMQMGQHPYLLILPGMHVHPTYSASDSYLDSKAFADATVEELRHLKEQFGEPGPDGTAMVSSVAALARKIEARPQGTPPKDWEVPKAPYRIEIDREVAGHGTHIYAERIDCCTGPGLARTWGGDKDTITDDALRTEYLAPVSSEPEKQGEMRRVVPAQIYLFAGIARPTNGVVMVIGGGPTAAWCVHDAVENGNTVWWATRELASAFPASQRNDFMIEPPFNRTDPTWKPKFRSAKIQVIMPGDAQSISPAGDKSRMVDVVLKNGPETIVRGDKTETVNWANVGESGQSPKSFDQVIASLSQVTQPNEAASASSVTDGLNWKSIEANDGRLLGLQTTDEAVRVLGAAAFTHPATKKKFPNPLTALSDFEKTLCAEARVGLQGLSVCTLTIALANQSFPHGNKNVNTAAASDYSAIKLSTPPQKVDFGSDRKNRVKPYTDATPPPFLNVGDCELYYPKTI